MDLVPFHPSQVQQQLCRERQTYFLLNNGAVAVVRNVSEEGLKPLVEPLKMVAAASGLVVADLSLIDKELRLVFVDKSAALSACTTAQVLHLGLQFPGFDLEIVRAQPSDWHAEERLEVSRSLKLRHYFRSELNPSSSRFAPDLVLDTYEPHVELWTNICDCTRFPGAGFYHRGMIGTLLPAALCSAPPTSLSSPTTPIFAPPDPTPAQPAGIHTANAETPSSPAVAAQQPQPQPQSNVSQSAASPGVAGMDNGGAGGSRKRRAGEELAPAVQGVEQPRGLPTQPLGREKKVHLVRIRDLEPRWNDRKLFMNFFRGLVANELKLEVRAFHGPDRCTNETYGFLVFSDLATASRAIDIVNFKLQASPTWAEHWDSVGDRSQVAVHASGRGFEWTLPERVDFAAEAHKRTGCVALVARCIGDSVIFLYNSNEEACAVVRAMEGASRGPGFPTLRCGIYTNPDQIDFGILPQLSAGSSGWKDYASRSY